MRDRDRSWDDHEERRASTLRGSRVGIAGREGGRLGHSMDPMDRYADFFKGMSVEARYQGHGAWYEAKVIDVNPDRTINVVYNDGEMASRLHPSTVRRVKEGKNKDAVFSTGFISFQFFSLINSHCYLFCFCLYQSSGRHYIARASTLKPNTAG